MCAVDTALFRRGGGVDTALFREYKWGKREGRVVITSGVLQVFTCWG